MSSTMMPSIALPTGPYDWHSEQHPRAIFEARLSRLRAVMTVHGATHAIVHGNGFDHGALHWLTHFTPKLGPAYALVPADGALRLLFAGGPGMKPSAARLTWIEDVIALKGIEADAKRWLDETARGSAPSVGLVEGASMLYGDWQAVQRAGDGATVALDPDIERLRAEGAGEERVHAERAGEIAALARSELIRLATPGADLRAAAIEMERAAYAAGAEDVRIRIGRRPGAAPVTLPDTPLPLLGPTQVALRVRFAGQHAEAQFVVGG
jgi:Xaa-Pro aminopeptidase